MVCLNCRNPIPSEVRAATRPGKRSERRRLEREALLAAKAPQHLPIQSRGSNGVAEGIVSIDDLDAKDVTH